MNGILLRLKIDPAAVQSPRGSNALQAVQTLFGLSLKKKKSTVLELSMVENQLKVIVIRIGNHVSNVPRHRDRAYLIWTEFLGF